MVYVMGLDLIAAKEASLPARNQLFVAMTRAKGWVHISGLNRSNQGFYDEFKRVIEAKGRYDFRFKRTPQRDLSDQDLSPAWSAVTTEVSDKYHPFIFEIADTLKAPSVYYKIMVNNKVVARPLLCWPEKKTAIIDGKSALKKLSDWRVITIQDAAQDPAEFMSLFG